VPLQYVQGDGLQITVANGLPAPVAITSRGIPGLSQIEPLLTRPPLAPGQTSAINVPLRHAGTVLFDARLLGDGQARALPARAISVLEKKAAEVDQDHTLLIEDWRLDQDGNASSPGTGPDRHPSSPLYTINGRPGFDISTRTNERLRLRFVNACQRSIVAIKLDDHDVRVMAIDSQPAEPFIARNGQLVLAPGTRIDAFVDATGRPSTTSVIQLHDGTSPRPIARLIYASGDPIRPNPLSMAQPLPSNGLPQKLELQNAQRIELPLDIPLDASSSQWLQPSNESISTAPAFRIKRGRVVVLTLVNRANTPVVLHLHGHHFRLLDRLDDGWKPFWLDTLSFDAQQTQRIAFMAENAGAWLIEAMGAVWETPRLVRWYAVD
jgi:FtsP/CotA-like multicopper oxidase with cupredoxin domain